MATLDEQLQEYGRTIDRAGRIDQDDVQSRPPVKGLPRVVDDHRRFAVAVGCLLLVLGGLLLVGAVRDTPETPPVSESPSTTARQVPAFDGGVCDPQPTPRPDDPEERAAWDDVWGDPNDLAGVDREAGRTGWQRSMGRSLTSDLWVCGWTKYTSLEDDLLAPDPQFLDSQGRVLFFDGPDGRLVGYKYGSTFVSIGELADPDIDVEALLTEKYGCVITALRQSCDDEPDVSTQPLDGGELWIDDSDLPDGLAVLEPSSPQPPRPGSSFSRSSLQIASVERRDSLDGMSEEEQQQVRLDPDEPFVRISSLSPVPAHDDIARILSSYQDARSTAIDGVPGAVTYSPDDGDRAIAWAASPDRTVFIVSGNSAVSLEDLQQIAASLKIGT